MPLTNAELQAARELCIPLLCDEQRARGDLAKIRTLLPRLLDEIERNRLDWTEAQDDISKLEDIKERLTKDLRRAQAEIDSLHEEVSTFRDALIYACDSFATMSEQRDTVRAIRTAANETSGSFLEAYDALDVYRSRKATP